MDSPPAAVPSPAPQSTGKNKCKIKTKHCKFFHAAMCSKGDECSFILHGVKRDAPPGALSAKDLEQRRSAASSIMEAVEESGSTPAIEAEEAMEDDLEAQRSTASSIMETVEGSSRQRRSRMISHVTGLGPKTI